MDLCRAQGQGTACSDPPAHKSLPHGAPKASALNGVYFREEKIRRGRQTSRVGTYSNGILEGFPKFRKND